MKKETVVEGTREKEGLIYRINDSIGVLKDRKAFLGRIAEQMKFENGIQVVHLADNRQALFDKIINETFEMDALTEAIRTMATLHLQEGTLKEYTSDAYFRLCGMVEDRAKSLKTLASATECAEDELSPLCQPAEKKQS